MTTTLRTGALNQIADFGPWGVEHFRLTLFHPPSVQTLPLWEQLVGVRPESIEERPREGVVRQHGGVDANRLFLATQGERLDWTFLPSPTADQGIAAAPTLSDPEQATLTLRRALDISLRSVRQVHRLAFGVLLEQRVTSQADGMSKLSKYLPHLNLEGQGGSDFIYQINRRRQSSVVLHASVNRVARWSLEQFVGGEVRITPTQVPQLQQFGKGFVDRLLLDINTNPENNAIAPARMPGLLVEFIDLAHKVASEGDVL